ncbi:MAG: cysteine desulfurase sulfur acceptor subunit CsdE, partial [Plesiomonas shigelloides]
MLGSHPFGTQITWSELESRFSACKLWEDRYRQLILLARQLPSLSEQERGSQLELYGCENRVWLGMQVQPDGRLHFYADSEGRIVKGLLAVILTRIEGLSADDVLALDIPAALA